MLRLLHTQLAAQLPSRYEVVEGAPPVSAAHLVHVPGTDQYLVVQGKGCAGGRGRLAAGVWDLASHVYTPLNLHENAVGAGHAVTADGSIFIAGGAAQVRLERKWSWCLLRSRSRWHLCAMSAAMTRAGQSMLLRRGCGGIIRTRQDWRHATLLRAGG